MWTFLVLEDPKHTEKEHKLVSGKLSCAICIGDDISPLKSWDWVRKSWGGSTSNFLRHFSKEHTKVWDQLLEKDEAIMNPNPKKKQETQGTLNSWSKVRRI